MDAKKTTKIEAKTNEISHNIAKILGIGVFSGRFGQALSLCLDWIDEKQKKVVFTPNPEFLVTANRDFEFAQMLKQADLCLPDGIGLVLAGRLLGQPIKERVSGADLVEKLLETGNGSGKWEVGSGSRVRSGPPSLKLRRVKKWAVGIAGARWGVLNEVEKLLKNLGDKYPNVRFVDLDNPQFTIYNLKFKIVFATHGMKKQEKWILENKDKIDASLFVGVGGSLDFLGGFSNRAPRLMRVVGFEWLWRGLQRPKHFLRIWRAVVEFGGLVIKEKLNYKF